jgi:hypothetical protein
MGVCLVRRIYSYECLESPSQLACPVLQTPFLSGRIALSNRAYAVRSCHYGDAV